MTEELRLSVSKTKCFEQCKKQFEFSYILKMPKKERDYHIFGTFCHLVLETFHKAYTYGNSQEPFNVEMNKAFKSSFEQYKEKMTPAMKKECWGIIDKYLKMISNDKKNNTYPNIIGVEDNFKLDIGNNVILNGMIDRVQIDVDNVMHVVDYKSSKSKKYLAKDFFQLLTYAFVCLDKNPDLKVIRASYMMLKFDNEYITTEFKVPDILKIKNKYLDYAHKIRTTTEYEPNPSALCNYCDHLDLCPQGQERSGKSNTFNNNVFGEVSW